jgi:carboxylesterase type B
LDGSYFAKNTNSIVVVVQYRLGVLGYLPPTNFNSNKNLGVQDVIMALKYVNRVAASFGGDKTKVTVAGQSSGGNMVRNLLAAPSAASYFSSAILQSDPIVSKTHTVPSVKRILISFTELRLLEHVHVYSPPE